MPVRTARCAGAGWAELGDGQALADAQLRHRHSVAGCRCRALGFAVAEPGGQPLVGTKLLLLVLYIVLGSLALKRAKAPAARRASYAGALMVYMFMGSVALSHHPLGFLQGWLTHGD